MTAKRNVRTFSVNIKRFIKYRLLHVNDSPHRIALGVGLGLFVAWTPTVGLHTIMVIVLATLLRTNKFVALSAMLVNNPLTIIPIFYSNYFLGNLILGPFNAASDYSHNELIELFTNIRLSLFSIDLSELCKNVFQTLWQSLPDLWLGSLIMAVFVGVCGYFATYYVVKWHRTKHPHRRFE